MTSTCDGDSHVGVVFEQGREHLQPTWWENVILIEVRNEIAARRGDSRVHRCRRPRTVLVEPDTSDACRRLRSKSIDNRERIICRTVIGNDEFVREPCLTPDRPNRFLDEA